MRINANFFAAESQPRINEVIDMTKQKAKPATKKMATVKVGKVVASKSNTAKAGVAATAKKPVVKKTATEKPTAKKTVVAVAKPKKTNVQKVKEVAINVSEKKITAKKPADSVVKPATTQKTMRKPTPEERYRMVETAAYFIAEQHCFQGRSDEHWAAAERKLNL